MVLNKEKHRERLVAISGGDAIAIYGGHALKVRAWLNLRENRA